MTHLESTDWLPRRYSGSLKSKTISAKAGSAVREAPE